MTAQHDTTPTQAAQPSRSPLVEQWIADTDLQTVNTLDIVLPFLHALRNYAPDPDPIHDAYPRTSTRIMNHIDSSKVHDHLIAAGLDLELILRTEPQALGEMLQAIAQFMLDDLAAQMPKRRPIKEQPRKRKASNNAA